MASLKNFSSRTKSIQMINCIVKKYFHCSSCLLAGDNVKKVLFVPTQKEKPKRRRKVSIIGAAGSSGVTIAYTLFLKNYCDEIVMVENKKAEIKLCANSLDFLHGTPYHKSPKITICMDMSHTKDSDLIIFNSGKPLTKGQPPLELAQENVCHFKEVVPPLAKLSPDSVMLVITSPTDIMAYAAWKYSCFEKNRIIGAGTELDSARFRYHIGQRLGINPMNISGWVIGEHGQSSVPVWSGVSIAGTRLREIDEKIGTCQDENCWDQLHKQVVKDDPMLVEMKKVANYGISQIADNIAKAVLSNARTVHSVSTQIKGLYGVETECFMSLPCVIGNRGVCEIVCLTLEDCEVEKLNASACALDAALKCVKFP